MKKSINDKISIIDNKYTLNNIDNYIKIVNTDIILITSKYAFLIIEYFNFIIENTIIFNSNISKFIIIRGLDTITNVFLHLLYFTNNIDLTYYHCQKSFYYYTEFIEQISLEQNIFLKLSSRDASLYVYKKTIYNINNSFCQKSVIYNEFCKNTQIYINLYQSCLIKIIQTDDVIKKTNIIHLSQLIQKINLNKKINITIFENIINKLYYKINDINLFFEINHLLIDKLVKNNNISKIQHKINLIEFDTYLNNNDNFTFIKWFLG
jgi:hypothetical protein